MRNLVLAVLIFFGSVANAQHTLDADVCTEFVHQKINELNLKIWNAVRSNRISAFTNDSLSTRLSSKHIDDMIALELTMMVPNPDNPNDEYDRIERKTIEIFDTLNGFRGVSLSYDFDYTSDGIKFSLKALALLYSPPTESGVSLGVIPLFFVKSRDIKTTLNKEDYNFIMALLKQRMTLGDFMNPYLYEDKDMKSFGGDAAYRTVFKSPVWNVFTAPIDTAIGNNILQLLTFSSTKYQQEKGVNIFYKDKELKETYKYVPFDLADSVTVTVPNPDFWDFEGWIDSAESVNRESVTLKIWTEFYFQDISKIEVYREGKDYILRLVNMRSEKEKFAYVRYSNLAGYLIRNDRVILETLLQEITK